ncbi:preprotein translocase subunit SecE [Brevundimonas sp. UBA7664]|jgi:preprotein translocase subunit SecE|uniref:preprotein translocase subunit SecE n=1 Tax=Brevundimonas sp. UBA7664 TaxID=1946141 RepID=UPI0025BEF7E7|nr:preprotein translocase subunit SecE [Brevundimonas sp. UBA7664]
MAKAKSPSGRRTQPAQPVIAGNAVAAEATAPKKRTSIPQFASQVRAELRKVVWPSRKETWITSVMVLIMVLIAAIFFWIVDWALAKISLLILAIGQ